MRVFIIGALGLALAGCVTTPEEIAHSREVVERFRCMQLPVGACFNVGRDDAQEVEDVSMRDPLRKPPVSSQTGTPWE